MANAVVTVLEADGVTETDVTVLDVGRQAAAASKSTAMSTEDKAVLDAINAILGASGDAASVSTTIKAALRAIATALGTTALDLGIGTGGTRTLRVALDSASQNDNGRVAAADSAPVVLSDEDLAVLAAIETATELIDDAVVADDAAFTPATTKVLMAGFFADEASTDSVTEGDGGAARMTLDRKQIVTPQPHSAGGLSVFCSLDLDESEEEVSAVPCCLYKIRATNRTTSVRYLKLYNLTAANTTVGSSTVIDTIPIPANASDYTVLTESFGGLGVTFDTALSIACTTGFAAADTGAPGANDVIVSAYYK